MYRVRLDVFEGPLDLLLHLIEERQLDIWQVSMAEVARQYLDVLAGLPADELEQAGEFLVLAAVLVRLKARHLLPKPTQEAAEEEAEDEAALEEALKARLAEYRRYKEAAEVLAELAAARELHRLRPAPTHPAPHGEVAREASGGSGTPPQAPPGLNLETILAAWRRMRLPEPGLPPPPPARKVNLRRAMGRLLMLVRRFGGRIRFGHLLRRASRWEWIEAFLALLELVRLGRVRVYQPEPLADLDIEGPLERTSSGGADRDSGNPR
ncbi:MAG: segregation/condensation protein A [Firmicutes bacterium]|nr:segregation/condensation protein A [Bacillota bacterium]